MVRLSVGRAPLDGPAGEARGPSKVDREPTGQRSLDARVYKVIRAALCPNLTSQKACIRPWQGTCLPPGRRSLSGVRRFGGVCPHSWLRPDPAGADGSHLRRRERFDHALGGGRTLPAGTRSGLAIAEANGPARKPGDDRCATNRPLQVSVAREYGGSGGEGGI